MTASVHFFSISHARNRSSSFTLVPNRRTSTAGFRSTGPVKTQTAKNFFPTSIPAQFSTLTSSMVSPYEERPTLSYHFVSRAVSTNRRFVLRRPDHFPNGVVATIDNIRPFLFALAIFKKQPSCSQAHPFHPRRWPAGPWGLSFLADPRTGRNAGFVDIQSATTFIHDSHDILLLRRHAEDVGSVESPSRAPQANLGIAQFRLKADNSWCHCNVRIKLVIGLAVATAAPSKGRSPCREMARSNPIQQAGHLGFLFMIRGVGKT